MYICTHVEICGVHKHFIPMISNNKKIVRNFNNSNYFILKTLHSSYKHEYIQFNYSTDTYLRVFESKALVSFDRRVQGTFPIMKEKSCVYLQR